ncbi:MAG: hypothetical protein ACRDRK_23595 [Pseudonocardia sp.]
MVLRLAGLPVWTPTDMIAGTRAVMGWTDEAIRMVAALPERVSGLLDDVDVLVARITEVVDRVEVIVGHIDPLLSDVRIVAESAAALVTRVDVVAENAAGVVVRADLVAEGAAGLIARVGDVAEEAGTTSRTAQELLGVYAPIAGKAAPLAKRFVDELSEEEIRAAIRLIDQLPLFTEHLETDIMPILATLDRVGPDVHELLDVLKEVRHAINGIPGFDYFRGRGEREEAAEEQSG